ncbi:MAG: hypothetical protein WAT78_04615 [Rhizobiaceae bacterium]
MAIARRPELSGLKRRLEAARESPKTDGYVRETFQLPREDARQKALEWFGRFPKAAYWTEIESWRVCAGDEIAFTMKRLKSAD